MSARWKFDVGDLRSAVRHTILPIVSGAAVAGLQAVQAGSFNLEQMKTAAATALLAGVIRMIQKWTCSAS